jgi:NAD-dependent SIR2 family protein deacetylase
MIDFSESRRIIKQAILDNKLVVFVGAGASKPSGVPLWFEAIPQINERLGKKFDEPIDKSEYLKVPQLYFNARGEKEYNELVKNIFKYDNKNYNEIHELIVQLSPCNVITTNYDDFLERAFLEKGEFLEVVERDTDIPYVKNNRMIIKMHGGFIHNNFVFKEDDYLNYSNNFQLIETYVKALIAKNVVFFVGYSYNDPDVKQLFNWTKTILGNDFQRAYLLDIENSVDIDDVNYYRNLGINILYASECLPKPFEKEQRYQNTVNFLKNITEDSEETDIVDIIHNQLSPLNELNYIMKNYITRIFNKKFAVYCDNVVLTLHNSDSIEFFEKFNSDIKDKRINAILKVFDKSIISHIRYTHFPDDKLICSFSDKNFLNDDFFDYIDTQNLVEVSNFANSINLHDDKVNKNEILKTVFAFYNLQEYEKCYYILKKLSSELKKEQNYVWYFIVEFNRYYLGKIWHIKQEIRDESSKIDLYGIFINYPLRENDFLKELLDFKLINNMIVNISKDYEKVEKDTHTNYIGGNGFGTIQKLEANVIEFYNYLQLNFIMVDTFSEVIEVYKKFIDAVFCSHSKEEKEYDEDNSFFLDSGKNVVLTELSPFMIIIICKYLNKKSLDEIIKKNFIEKITLNKEAEDVLFEIFENCNKSFENKLMNYIDVQKIHCIITILSKVQISKERFKQTLIIINKLIANGYSFSHEFYIISIFIASQYNVNQVCIDESVIFDTINDMSKRIINNDIKTIPPHQIIQLLKNCSFIVKTKNKELLLEDKIIENMMLNSQLLYLISIFSLTNSQMQEKIKNEITIYFENNDFNLELYSDAVIANVISPSMELEDKMLAKLQLIYKDNPDNPNMITRPDPKNQALSYCVTLHLNDKLLDAEKFSSYFLNSKYENQFLYNMDKFDYNNFQISWMIGFSDNLKKLISKNDTARTKIKNIYKEVFKNEDYDKNMLNDYFKYFDK